MDNLQPQGGERSPDLRFASPSEYGGNTVFRANYTLLHNTWTSVRRSVRSNFLSMCCLCCTRVWLLVYFPLMRLDRWWASFTCLCCTLCTALSIAGSTMVSTAFFRHNCLCFYLTLSIFLFLFKALKCTSGFPILRGTGPITLVLVYPWPCSLLCLLHILSG